jgi:IS605 OrfB family transposase
LFQQDHWNGRLQAPRIQLDAIARHVDEHGWDAKARGMIDRIRWLVSFSAELTQQGPWTEYCDRFEENAPAKPFTSQKGEYAVKHRDNDQRKGQAKLILSRLPGLRVLAVDLGHRYAAACAVWEAITQEQMQQACADAGIPLPDASAMYVHLLRTNSLGKPTTTIYRRIGPDVLLDNTPHPAPWVRLDRQFLIKLQGEDRSARKASPDEIAAVERFEQWTGQVCSDTDPPRELTVDALMSDAVRTARFALARHSRRARIARDLIAKTRLTSGNREQVLDDAGRLELLLDMLADWHTLVTDWRWNDESARQLWNSRLAVLDGGSPLQLPTQSQQEFPKAQRREAEQALRAELQPLAQTLAGNEMLRRELHRAWCARWSADDDQWKQQLKWLSRWLMPRRLSRLVEVVKQNGKRVKRRKPIREAIASASNVGGLSLTRITTLTEFRRKVQVGYFTRLLPDGTHAELGAHFGQSTLDAIQRLKDQRIKQLASRIVEGALGIAVEQDPVWDDVKRKWRDPKRPRQRSTDPRFAPCHAVIIEDLSHYRPEETRTRRENRATMDWKSAETRKRLADHCQLYGLYLRDVNPQYTSRQCSRTGLPGVRCADVPVADFLDKPWWRKAVKRAKERKEHPTKDKPYDAEAQLLVALDAEWPDRSAVPEAERSAYAERVKSAKLLRLFTKGGDLFVAAPPSSCHSHGHKPCPLCDGKRAVQADLNAAANIGLRALLDPDYPGKWWYVLCGEADAVPRADKVKGSTCFGKEPEQFGALQSATEPIPLTQDGAAGSKKAKNRGRRQKDGQNSNYWADPSGSPLRNAANHGFWLPTPAYWRWVRKRVIAVLRRHNSLTECPTKDLKPDDAT